MSEIDKVSGKNVVKKKKYSPKKVLNYFSKILSPNFTSKGSKNVLDAQDSMTTESTMQPTKTLHTTDEPTEVKILPTDESDPVQDLAVIEDSLGIAASILSDSNKSSHEDIQVSQKVDTAEWSHRTEPAQSPAKEVVTVALESNESISDKELKEITGILSDMLPDPHILTVTTSSGNMYLSNTQQIETPHYPSVASASIMDVNSSVPSSAIGTSHGSSAASPIVKSNLASMIKTFGSGEEKMDLPSTAEFPSDEHENGGKQNNEDEEISSDAVDEEHDEHEEAPLTEDERCELIKERIERLSTFTDRKSRIVDYIAIALLFIGLVITSIALCHVYGYENVVPNLVNLMSQYIPKTSTSVVEAYSPLDFAVSTYVLDAEHIATSRCCSELKERVQPNMLQVAVMGVGNVAILIMTSVNQIRLDLLEYLHKADVKDALLPMDEY